MTKKESIESFTLDEIKARRNASGINPALYRALSDAEVESRAAGDSDDPTNIPGFWESSEQRYPLPPSRSVSVEIEEEILQFIKKHHWNLGSSVNAALKAYMREHS